MTYNNLNSELQNILVYNHEITIKFFILIGLLFVSCLYLFYISKQYNETDNIFTALYRVITKLLFNMYLYTFPLLYIFLMHPGYNFSNMVVWLISLYSICLMLFTIYIIYGLTMLPVKILKAGLLNPKKIHQLMIKELKLK
jgi:hypothetical protein